MQQLIQKIFKQVMGNTSISVAQFVFFPVKGDFAMTLAEKLQELFVSTALGQSL